MELAVRAPQLCEAATGLPKSWYHYVYGEAYLRRLDARESLQMFGAVLAASTDQEHMKEWRDEQTDAARLNE